MEKFADALVRAVSDRYSISSKQAVENIESCISEIALNLELQWDYVHAMVMTPEFMKLCFAKNDLSCDQRTLDDCEKSCTCVVYQGQCRPRYFEDAELMNADPDKYIIDQKLSTADLEKLVEFAAFLYYNFDAGGITDNTFDAFEYVLKKRLKVKGRLYEKIGAPPVEKIRVALPYPMASLAKVKPNTKELREFFDSQTDSEALVWSEKLDGNSAMIVYQNGKPVEMYTMGNGTVGGNISYMIEYLSLPTITPSKYQSIVVRGELIISKAVFENKYKSSYSFPRSFVTAKSNSGFISPGLSDIEFVAYQIVDGPTQEVTPNKVFLILESLKFKVPAHGLIENPTEAVLMVVYKNQRAISPYTIDGLVITFNQPMVNWVRPKTVAFKMLLEEQLRKTEVISIDWRISRYGVYVPVAIYNAVFVDGARLHKALAFNAAHVRDWSLGRGTVITIARSGDVIPQIKDVDVNSSIEPIYPPTDYPWHWSDKIIELDDIEGNKMVQVKRMSYFFETIRVPGLRMGMLEKMYDHGLSSLNSITNADEKRFKQVKGIGPKKAQMYYGEIHKALKSVRMDRLIVASSTQSGLGRSRVKQLLKVFPDLFRKSESEIRTMLKAKKVKGFGPKLIEQAATQIPEFMKFVRQLHEGDIEEALEKDIQRLQARESPNPLVDGKTFVFTAFMDHPPYELEDFIDDNNGSIGHKVGESTSAVIVGPTGGVTDKMEQAFKLGLPIYTLEEFGKVYGYRNVEYEEDEV